ncbi:MAG: formylglycine-generating enzyme required for sulfatase activity/predicted Ser/Thr protein kinase [Planctomycetota bacterium]|jgi:formylglycine-generating enzyme required for sulfatase activity/predicted Ser/Thr protein kinase
MSEHGSKASRHEHVGNIFLAAAELKGDAREGFLLETCAGDDDLREEVDGLLMHDECEPDDFLTTHSEANRQAHLHDELGLRLPKSIGPFRVLRELGQGSMGVVYEAVQEEPQRTVALKVLRFGLASKAARRRFAYEVEILASLQHPRIAKVLQAGTAKMPQGEFPYFAMEVVRGEPLIASALRRKLDLGRRLTLFNKICSAVQHAHNRGVVHRDLKPSNILVDDEGEPHVLDFGVARAVEPSGDTETWRTRDGQLVGTLPYMSPEQAGSGSQTIDTRTDVYSLGVLLFELLSGELPLGLSNLSVPAAVLAICKEQPRRLGEVSRVLRGDLETITAKALEKDPDDRYPSAADLASDVTRFLLNEPIVARPPSLGYIVRKFAGRNRALVTVVIGGVLALMVALGFTSASLRRALLAEDDSAENLREVNRFADQLVADELIEETEGLFPRTPEMVREYETWLQNATTLIERRSSHEAFAARLDAEIAESELLLGQPHQPMEETLPLRWRLIQGKAILHSLDQVASLMASVKKRLAFAKSVERLTLLDQAAAWKQSANDVRTDPRTSHINLKPQLGLIPVGTDPESGLAEFWLPGTGVRPVRHAETGRYRIEPDSGMVLVLLPGDTFQMGSRPVSTGHPLGSPNVDDQATAKEQPVHAVHLAPFFMSKYELTQGQWLQVRPTNPSGYTSRNRSSETLPYADNSHPVESMNWEHAASVAHDLSLLLPTEAQWEYAARGGTSSIWWTGNDINSLQGAENLADQTTLETFAASDDVPGYPWIAELRDPWLNHSPVGRMLPNPYGLHDCLGNISEWMRDTRADYDIQARPLDGLRNGPPERPAHSRRGGSYRGKIELSHVAHRIHWTTMNRGSNLGLRLSRALEN